MEPSEVNAQVDGNKITEIQSLVKAGKIHVDRWNVQGRLDVVAASCNPKTAAKLNAMGVETHEFTPGTNKVSMPEGSQPGDLLISLKSLAKAVISSPVEGLSGRALQPLINTVLSESSVVEQKSPGVVVDSETAAVNSILKAFGKPTLDGSVKDNVAQMHANPIDFKKKVEARVAAHEASQSSNAAGHSAQGGRRSFSGIVADSRKDNDRTPS